MGGWTAAGKGLLIAFLLAFTAAISPSASAASTKKAKGSDSPPLMLQLPVDTGRRDPSSVVFPIYGDVYPHGLYYVAMSIGNPPKPYFLDIDTGSDLTWLQCDAPCVRCSKGPHPWYRPTRNKLVPCRDPLCAALHTGTIHDENCDQCDYQIQYEDRGSSLGVLISDAFNLRLINTTVVRPVFAFGCGYDQQFAIQNAPTPTDGLLGLGTGKISVLSQLSDQGVAKNVMGHCLGGKGGGYLFFGDDFVPTSLMTWAPMSRSRNYYSPGPANLYWGTRSLGVNQMEVVFDTGSTFTYFGFQPYQAFLSAVKSDLSKKPLKEEFDDPSLPVCWKGPKAFKSVKDVKKHFKTLALNFVNGNRALLEVPPENYLIITKHGNACLGILNGTEAGLNKDLNIIGDISMQDRMVVYDNERQHIGWVQIGCDRLPKPGASSR